MKASAIGTVYRKELRDALRDRRTLISMIVIPTLIMPALIFLVGFIGMKVVKKARAEVPSVMLLGGEEAPGVRAALTATETVRLVEARTDWREQVAAKTVRAVVELPPDFEARLKRGEPAEVKLYHYEGELKSGLALRQLRTFFTELRTEMVTNRLQDRGLPETLVKPFEIKAENVAPPEKVGGNAIGGFLPYLFIILCFTGAMYPAIDLTAGEKERGTMETILCSPIGRFELVLGKFLLVLTASLATVVLALVSMALTFAVAGSLLAGGGIGGGAPGGGSGPLPSLDPLGLMATGFMVLPFAVLFSALQLSIALFAKSYKEAQSYISPLIVVVILPAVVGMLPGVELNAKLALVPVLNLSLVSKEMVSGVFNWSYIALIFGSSCVYALAALGWCVRMFNREDVIFRT